MVIIDQFRISEDGKRLYLNAHVNTAKAINESNEEIEIFGGVYIKRVTIVSAEEASETLDVQSIIENEKYLFSRSYETGVKEVNLVLDSNNFIKRENIPIVSKMNFCTGEMQSTLFFVFIETDGQPSSKCSCIPCSMNKSTTMGATFDENAFYQKVMNYTKQLAQDCTIPMGFSDFILQWNAFKASIDTEHYIPAIKFYNMMFGKGNNDTVSSSTKGCGCHG